MSDEYKEPQLMAAIAKVMAGISKLPKGDKNQHGGYDFASIDAFLVAVNPLCAEHGVVILQHEVSSEVLPSENKKPNLHCVYEFTLAHSGGETYGPIRRSVMVMAVGAQAYGTAQSYALKQFMRSTFLIATGDEDDPDHNKAAPLSIKDGEPATTWTGPLTKTALKNEARAFSTGLGQAQTSEDITILLDQYQPMLDQLQSDIPNWYFGDDDQPGAKKSLQDKRDEIGAVAA
jgi:hypothetical protein